MKKLLLLVLVCVFINSPSKIAYAQPFSHEQPTQFVDEVLNYLNKRALYRNEPAFKHYFERYQRSSINFPSMSLAMMEIEIALKKAGGNHSQLINYKDNLIQDNLSVDYPTIAELDEQIVHITMPSTANFIAQYHLQDEHFDEKLTKYETLLTDYVRTHPIRGIVLDLRENNGGHPVILFSALNFLFDNGVALNLIDSTHQSYGQITFSEKGLQTEDFYSITHRSTPIDVPIAILTSHSTASAAEVIALALRYNDNYQTQIFGQATAGFTSDMQLIHLCHHTFMKLAVGGFLTPDGTTFMDEPIIPDIISDTPERDALQWLKEQL